MKPQFIILLRCITMFCGTDNILQNIPHIQFEYTNDVVELII